MNDLFSFLNKFQPIFIRRDSNKAFQWRIRNLPYPVNVYSVTVNEDNSSITIKTSNKKYVRLKITSSN